MILPRIKNEDPGHPRGECGTRPPCLTYPSEVTEENGDAQGCSSAPAELDDWPIDDPSVDVARLRESLMQSEADIAAGRTFGEDEIRTRYGLPRK